MSLTPLQCAAQFDLYAKSHQDVADKQRAHAQTLDEGIGRSVAAILADPSAEAARVLRFAATFLRENAVLRWTKDLPDRPGYYHYRWSRDGVSQLRAMIHVILHQGVLKAGDENEGYHPLAGTGPWPESARWAGPVSEPEEPTQP